MSVQKTDTEAIDVEQAGESGDETTPTLTEDQIFHLLQNQRRRNVLRYLQGTDEPVRMRDIAEQVAAWEHETTLEGLTSNQRQRVYIPLYQSHLPKLDEEGIIDYQQSRGIVERKSLADELDPYLISEDERVDQSENEDGGEETAAEWDDYYIGVTGVAGIILFGAFLEVPVLSVISGMALSAVILLMYTFLTVSRYVSHEVVPTNAKTKTDTN
ncbi:hypothetical protein OB955_15535 [Halobacteria archaeon AArc-m2/3/4]|uniref:DUF7344 domain-containing protein n=1 Tax=Natronoglomus mannanivorans TaxID=2979990 RepID=A0AAP2Z1D4_9EURY|nr:hypothetical protein [Halobacteria archaeon AArc-xg1-1]MCU4974141.1 hypothetical protein [Halobacteria archaeon AArc-m2/3/4]